MASNNSKYTPEYRKEVCQLIISSGRSATSIAEEMGIDKNPLHFKKQNTAGKVKCEHFSGGTEDKFHTSR